MQHASQGQSRLVVPMKHPGVSARQLLKQPLVLPAGRTAALLLCVVVAIRVLVYVEQTFRSRFAGLSEAWELRALMWCNG
jgi:hypothetical protein